MFIISAPERKGHKYKREYVSKNIVIRWTLYYVLILVIIMFGYTGGGGIYIC